MSAEEARFLSIVVSSPSKYILKLMEQVFCYGTLQDTQEQMELFVRTVKEIPDALEGYTTEQISTDGISYPRAIPSASGILSGIRLALSKDELKKADEHEDPDYKRIQEKLQR